MVVVSHILGGIGNQLFQYAASLAFSRLYDAKLYLDLTTFDNPKYVNPEGFLLDKIFKIDVCHPTSIEYFKTLGLAAPLLPFRFKMNYGKLCKNYFLEKVPSQLEERFFTYDNKHCYLEGYWQKEDYFKSIRELIIKKYHFNHDVLSNISIKMSHALINENSVSIHVRRGDYIANNLYFECDEKYFRTAMDYISKRISDVKFYVFSDDIDWAKEQSFFSQCHFFDYDQLSGSWNDLFLMSCCKHNIIANSSFSWWGAWLNQNPTKIVIGPKRWFIPDELYNLSPIPDNWIKI